jgi:hypothetical protein
MQINVHGLAAIDAKDHHNLHTCQTPAYKTYRTLEFLNDEARQASICVGAHTHQEQVDLIGFSHWKGS